MQEDSTIELIDVRTEQERDAYDIGGTHMPLDELESYLPYFASTNTKVFYCATGKRSGEAVKLILKKIPEADVWSLEGGLHEF
jgi:rhodanese-related sulfurtransferase